jgi:uncharacterized protein (TIGR00303 family)
VDAGSRVKPSVPFVSFGLDPGGDITKNDAMSVASATQALHHGELLGKELGRLSDLVVIGESIPGGTTTALAVLTALGIDARFKVSSSMPENPHILKNRILESALARTGFKPGDTFSGIQAVSALGDPMIAVVAGIATGALAAGNKVMLAGGTQMTAVAGVMKSLGTVLKNLCIGTTSYVTKDPSSDLIGLAKAVSADLPVLGCDLHLEESGKPGLRAFSNGYVKEGVGAGGASLASMLRSSKITGRTLMKAVEKEYETCIERSS